MLDDLGNAEATPSVDELADGQWQKFRTVKPAGIRLGKSGLLTFFDTAKPWFKFSVTRQVFTASFGGGADLLANVPAFTGDVIFYDPRHPLRRIYCPQEIFWDTHERGFAEYAKADIEAQKALELTHRKRFRAKKAKS